MVPFSLICASRSFSSAAEDSLSASLDAEEASLLLAAPDVVPPEEQLGARWLGGGAARAMANTALFQATMLAGSAPLGSYSQFMAPAFLRKAMATASTAKSG